MKVTSAEIAPVARILLVDDNRLGLIARKAVLEDAGHRITTALEGQEAFEHFSRGEFELVITDYKMPRMNGAEFILRIRKLDPNARVILLSGFVDPLGLTEQNTGADTVIEKSAREPAHLVRAVKRLLNRPPARKPPGRQGGGSALSRQVPRGNLAH